VVVLVDLVGMNSLEMFSRWCKRTAEVEEVVKEIERNSAVFRRRVRSSKLRLFLLDWYARVYAMTETFSESIFLVSPHYFF
jgi:hypothetical protein